MQIEQLHVGARNLCLSYADGGLYHTLRPYEIRLNGEKKAQINTVVFSLFHLQPDREYHLELMADEEVVSEHRFKTKKEYVTLNPRDFGALGDGENDDTAAIQAAIACCPKDSRVLLSKGRYQVTGLFLKSHLRLEIEQGAELLLSTKRSSIPMLPGMTESYDEQEYYNIGTWEGNPLTMHAALINGIQVRDVEIYGEGLLDGQAASGDWWQHAKQKRAAWRGRMLFLNDCQSICVQGLQVKNSPSWNLHPYFSRDLCFFNLSIQAPADSPNTDGFNPESCKGIRMAGTHFSLGDDCIAIKSGKIYMGSTKQVPCEGITISHCLMENGHGGVTIGSEMAGGVRDVLVRDCLMRNTDRGLRIKTRRGRGVQGRIDNIRFERVKMEGVKCPVVVNCHYACDPDGHSDYVQSRNPLVIDNRTPSIGRLHFESIDANDCHWAAAYIAGLPEQAIEELVIRHSRFSYADAATAAAPAMADDVDICHKRGIIGIDIDHLELYDVEIREPEGEALFMQRVNKLLGGVMT